MVARTRPRRRRTQGAEDSLPVMGGSEATTADDVIAEADREPYGLGPGYTVCPWPLGQVICTALGLVL